jgi:asparagine synthase (glutamine-hydrolysing)
MCGIVGCVNSSTGADHVLERMTQTLKHRGPDGHGYYTSPDQRVAFGHRRLSVIDLAGGAQPMSNEDGTKWVVFNGEVYNFVELRAELQLRNHRFRTQSDTEVVVHAYEEYGEDCVNHFNGMFAFAIYDERRQRLFLARDRFGKKPLYYSHHGHELLFASELKALLCHPTIGRELDHRALLQYLIFEYVPNPRSIFRDVRKLPPAHWMDVDVRTGEARCVRYWHLEFQPKLDIDEREAGQEILRLLGESVRRRLVSDVPVGVLLSGGVDSGMVTAFASQYVGADKLMTFNIAFRERSFDESQYAREIAQHFGTEHHEEEFSASKMLDVFSDVLPGLDEPFADASLLPTFLLCRFARSHVTVALGGDGCDEFMAGYPTFAAARIGEWYRRVPKPLRWAAERAVDHLPTSMENFSLDFKLRQFLRGSDYDDPTRTQFWLGSFQPHELRRLLKPEVMEAVGTFDPLNGLHALAESDGDEASWLDRLVRYYANFYLADDILFKIDRASMANSLEVRSPFLDPTLVTFLNQLPASCKIRGLRGKHALKKAIGGMLPPRIVSRPKKGFGIPIASWINGDLADTVDEELSARRLERTGVFEPRFVQSLLREHRSGIKNNRKLLWTTLVFQRWAQYHLGNGS